MGLSDSDQASITSLWEKIAPEADNLGSETLSRLFEIHPETKSFFSRFDLTPGSQDLLSQGGKLFNALGEASKNLDSLSQHHEIHAKMKLNEDHTKLLNAVIVEVLAAHYPGDFVQTAWEKFLCEVSRILIAS